MTPNSEARKISRGAVWGRRLGLVAIATLVGGLGYYWSTTLGFETTDRYGANGMDAEGKEQTNGFVL